jgi:imidazolonepropionase-like amidohydrolase
VNVRARKLFLSLVLSATFAAHISAQQAPRQKAPARVAIKAGTLLDVRTGQYASNLLIVVEGERIVSVGGPAPAGVPVIDLSNVTVLPGLIDAHDHILGNPKDQSPTASLRMSAPQAAIWGVRNLQVWLDHGFTGLREACEPAVAYAQLALRDSVRTGLIRGPRIVSAGNCLSVTADMAMTTHSLRIRRFRAGQIWPIRWIRSAWPCARTSSTAPTGSS